MSIVELVDNLINTCQWSCVASVFPE